MNIKTIDLKSHWNKTYDRNDINKLGWYEESPEPSLQLITGCNFNKEARLLNVGAGATTLIDELIKAGYVNIIANDISSSALEKLNDRLLTDSNKVRFIVDDLTKPSDLNSIEPVDLWHDRAVLHFFTENKVQQSYFKLLKKLVKPKGYVIIASFNLESASKCSGLSVHRYNESMLTEQLGKDFELIECFNYTYTMPSEDTRGYVYTLYRRK